MQIRKLDKRKGILFWITGLSGSGKTSIAKKIKKDISKKYGPSIVISGDNLRKIFVLDKYDYYSRLLNMKKFLDFAKFITDQKINLIFAVVGLIEKPKNSARKKIANFIEIYLKSDIKKIIKKGKKKLYKQKKNNIVGISIKPEFPKKADIVLNNDYKKSIEILSKVLLNKIHKKIKL